MRQITTTIYKYSELPTDEAKKAARDWWYDLECQDPAWHREHRESLENATEWLERFDTVAHAIKAESLLKDCPWTGYCGDEVARDYIRECEEVTIRQACVGLADHMLSAWDDELASRYDDAYITDTILANDYEFNSDGSIA